MSNNVGSSCSELAKRFETKSGAGLVDVKFFVGNTYEAVHETVCQEVNRLYEAVEAGNTAKLDFNDSHCQS
jgi:hypothetical protein